MSQAATALQVMGQTDHLGRVCRSTREEPFIPTAMCKPTSTCMTGSSLIHVHQLISFIINPSCAMCTKLTLIIPRIKCRSDDDQPQGRIAWLWHSMVWPSSQDKCAKFHQHSETVSHRYQEESDTFQVQLSN